MGRPISKPASAWPKNIHLSTLPPGVHPHDAAKATPDDLARSRVARASQVIAIGEIGLDYHYDFSPRDVAESIFIEQMAIAGAARKPIVIHTREAWDDTLALIEQHWKPHRLPGIMHCFSGGPGGGATRAGPRLLSELRRNRDVSKSSGRASRGAAKRRGKESWSRPMRPISRRSPSAASETSRPLWFTPRGSWPNCAESLSRASARRRRKTFVGCSAPAPDYTA